MQSLNFKNDIKKIKKIIIDTIKISNAGHITSSFSSLEILYAIYIYIFILNNKGIDVSAKLRDRVIISKEHCRLGQVCVLAYLGLLEKEQLKKYCVSGGNLGHDLYNIVNDKIPAIDYSSGSLGHGANVGAGIALGDSDHHVYVLMGDGELQEGSVYEAMIFIIQHKINNITLVIDRNNMQIDNYVKNIIDTSSNLKERMIALGFDVLECNGHDVEELITVLNCKTELPKCIIANTKKGNGIEFLLKSRSFAGFHHSGLSLEDYERVYEALEDEQ